MGSFRDLIVWQKAHALSLKISTLCEKIRKRKPGLARQLERAAEAIASHIAEGRGRGSDPDFSRFLSMGIGSANETENCLQKAVDHRLIAAADHVSHTELTIEVRKMMIGLKRRLDGKDRGPTD